MKGMNLAPWRTFNDVGTGSPTTTAMADFWYQWEWSAAGQPFGGPGNFIKPQIDLAIANGANYIRLMNPVIARNPLSGYANILSDAQWLDQWKQVLDYCRSCGIYCYPTLEADTDSSSGVSYWGFSPNNAWRVQEYPRLLRLFRAYLDVVPCVDIMNEGMGWASSTTDTSYKNPGGNVYNGTIIWNALKPIAPELPMTISCYFKAQPNQTNPLTNNSQGQRVPNGATWDYVDAHCYYNAAATDYDVIMQQLNVPCLIGEFGDTVGSGNRAARYNAVLALRNQNTSGRVCAGAALWSITDYNTASTDQYGYSDSTGAVRSDVSSIWAQFTT